MAKATKGFDLGDVLAGVLPVSGSDTREQISYIELGLIDEDKANFYSVDGIDELAANIELIGLQQPLRVRENPDMPGRYLIVSGHRRRRALWILYEENPEKWGKAPCIVEQSAGSAALQELRLIYANADTRRMSSADLAQQAERVERLLYQLKEEGYEFPGRMRDHVAQACQVSATKLATLKVIREKLAACWTQAYENGTLAESVAYALARQPLWIQQTMNRVKKDPTAAAVDRIGAIMQAGNDYKCTGLTGPGCRVCTHGDAFLRHDLEDFCSPCKGQTCCLKCDKATRDWFPCDRMCSKAKAKRSAANAAEKEKQAEKERKKKRQLLEEIAESAARLLKAADAAGVGDETEIKRSSRYYSSRTVGWCRKAVAGEDIGNVYENDLDPKELDVAAVAKALHCSADYICGLTDELHPSGPQATQEPAGGEPPAHGEAAPSAFVWTPMGDPYPPTEKYVLTVDATGLMEIDLLQLDGAWEGFSDSPTHWAPLPPAPGEDGAAVTMPQTFRTAEWSRDAEPPAEGRYLCLVDMNTSTLHEQRCDWRDGAWYAFGHPVSELFQVLAWYPLPKEDPHPAWWLDADEEVEE